MNGLLIYALEMLTVSVVFYLGYLLIRNHTTPTFRRFYLLSWLTLSVVFPFITIKSSVGIPTNIQSYAEPTSEQVFSQPPSYPERLVKDEVPEQYSTKTYSNNLTTSEVDWTQLLMVFYLVITFFFLFKIGYGLMGIWKLKKSARKVESGGRSIFEVDNKSFKGASFFNFIFIGTNLNEDRNSIIEHEILHSKLLHSVDILLSHVFAAVCWFNPLAWQLKKFITVNNEMEVDDRLKDKVGSRAYAHLLLNISSYPATPILVNHFSAKHLKARIKALKDAPIHRTWVSGMSVMLFTSAFLLVSCKIDGEGEVMSEAKLADIKTITTRFTSHQSDTQQKTGKVVAIATFLPDGSVDEFVEQTTYPYDHEFDKKKSFWEEPDKAMLPYIMDGLSLGTAEKSFLYGHDWPSAYAKFLKERSEKTERSMPWKETIEVDNEMLPTEIKQIKDRGSDKFVSLMPDLTEYFVYEEGKVKNVYYMNTFPESEETSKIKVTVYNEDEAFRKRREEAFKDSGVKKLSANYTYEDDLLSGIDAGRYQYKFYHEENVLIKSEYYVEGELIHTRFHYYKYGLKDRTEIFNRYNEAEYTIHYEYEYWEQ